MQPSALIDHLRQPEALWERTIKPLFAIFVAAHAPLSSNALQHLLANDPTVEIDDYELALALNRLEALLAVDAHHRYALLSPQVNDYLLSSLLTGDELTAAHQHLARWCHVGAEQEIWQDLTSDPFEQERREYARRYYVAHLAALPDKQALFSVLDEGSYGREKLQFDPSAHAYMLDLDRGREAVATGCCTDSSLVTSLSRLWSYTLLRCNLVDYVNKYPEEAFALLLQSGEVDRALTLAEALSDELKKIPVFLQLAVYFGQHERVAESAQLLTRAEELADAIDNQYICDEALASVAMALIEVKNWSEAERVIGKISLPDVQSLPYRNLASGLCQDQQWAEAERISVWIDGPDDQAQAYYQLASGLSQTQQQRFWQETERVIGEIFDPVIQAQAYHQLATYFLDAHQTGEAERIWQVAVQRISELRDSEQQVKVYRVLAEALEQVGQQENAQLLWKALESVARQLVSEPAIQAQAYRWLARRAQQQKKWAVAEKLITEMSDPSEQASAFLELAEAFQQDQQTAEAKRVWSEAERVSAAIPDPFQKATAYGRLAQSLSRSQQEAGPIWSQVESLVSEIEAPESQVQVYRWLVEGSVQGRQWQEAEWLIGKMTDPFWQTWMYSDLAVALHQNQQTDEAQRIWRRGEQVVATIPSTETSSLWQANAYHQLIEGLCHEKQLAMAERLIGKTPYPIIAERLTITEELTQELSWDEVELAMKLLADPIEPVEVLNPFVTGLTSEQDVQDYLKILLKYWLKVERKEQARRVFQLHRPFIALYPELKAALLEASTHVETALRSSYAG